MLVRASMAALAVLHVLVGTVSADTLRIAAFDVGMSRDGPGLLVHELEGSPEPSTLAVAAVIRAVRPDVLLLTRFDHDLHGRALDAFRALLRTGPDGIDYPHAFQRAGERRRAVGAGPRRRRAGDGARRRLGLGPVSRARRYGHRLAAAARRRCGAELRAAAVAALPGAMLPTRPDGSPFPDAERQAALRLSSRSHWDVPVVLEDGGRLHLLASNPTPPLFDGAEGFNRRRNRDEVRFWTAYLDGTAFTDDQGRRPVPPTGRWWCSGTSISIRSTEPDTSAVSVLLEHPRLLDPRPASTGGKAAGSEGVNGGHDGDPGLDTADWRDDDGPGNLRVDYVLPSAGLKVAGAGVFWPGPASRGCRGCRRVGAPACLGRRGAALTGLVRRPARQGIGSAGRPP